MRSRKRRGKRFWAPTFLGTETRLLTRVGFFSGKIAFMMISVFIIRGAMDRVYLHLNGHIHTKICQNTRLCKNSLCYVISEKLRKKMVSIFICIIVNIIYIFTILFQNTGGKDREQVVINYFFLSTNLKICYQYRTNSIQYFWIMHLLLKFILYLINSFTILFLCYVLWYLFTQFILREYRRKGWVGTLLSLFHLFGAQINCGHLSTCCMWVNRSFYSMCRHHCHYTVQNVLWCNTCHVI